MENGPTSKASEISRRRFLQLGAAASAVSLAGCDTKESTEQPKKSERLQLLESLGIEGPTLIYISIDGCSADGGPHSIKNLQKIVSQTKAPTYVIDISNFPRLKEEEKEALEEKKETIIPKVNDLSFDGELSFSDVVRSDPLSGQVKDTKNNVYPGKYVHVKLPEVKKGTKVFSTEDVAESARKLGFVVFDDNLFNHDNTVMLLNKDLEIEARASSTESVFQTISRFNEVICKTNPTQALCK